MKILKIILILSILSGIIITGFYLRILTPNRYTAKTYNVYAYYFYKSQYLNDHGRLPEKDIWSLAPKVSPENVPPLLAYANVGLYKLIKFFKTDVDFYNFAMLFPVIIYVFWVLLGFWLIAYLFKNYLYGFIFVALLTVMPLSFYLTSYGYYTEEGLGAFLFFLSLIFLIKFIEAENQLFFWLTVFSLTAFCLTWQQFPIFLAGLFIIGSVQILTNRKKRPSLIIYYSSIIVLPLIFGHLISYYLIKIDYSPIAMLYEAYLGVKNIGSEFIQVAMFREDWRNLYLGELISLIGLGAWILIGVGFLKSALNFKNSKHQVILIFSVLSLAVAIKFFKSRYLALAPLSLIAVSGVEFFLEKSKGDWQRLVNFSNSVASSTTKIFSRQKAIFLMVILGALIICLSSYSSFFQKEAIQIPQPVIIFSSLPENLEIGKEYQIGMKLENKGIDSLKDPASFGGFHIEVEGAKVENIVSWTDRGQSQVIIKPDARRENIYWFEAKYSSFKAEEFGYLWFKIIPEKLPVNIYYRAWLPGELTFWQRLKTILSLSPDFRDWQQNSWRSEETIQRRPANNDASQEFCLIKVFAAYQEIQNFRCFKKALK